MTQPQITIITVIYNLIQNKREQTFRQCLQSIHDQNGGQIEHFAGICRLGLDKIYIRT